MMVLSALVTVRLKIIVKTYFYVLFFLLTFIVWMGKDMSPVPYTSLMASGSAFMSIDMIYLI